jgi:hypothetical protein
MKRYLEIIAMCLPAIIIFITLQSHEEIKTHAKKTCINLCCSLLCFTFLFFLLSSLHINRYVSVCIAITVYLVLTFIQKNILV